VENEGQGIVEGLAPYEMKEQTANNLRVRNVGTLTTLGNFASPVGKQDDCDTPGLTDTIKPLETSSLKEGAAGAVGE
jgi:hypothetical protein